MKVKSLWVVGLLNVLFIVFGSVYTKSLIEKTEAFSAAMHEHVTTLDFKDRLFNQKEWLILLSKEVASFVEDTEWNEKNIVAEEQLKQAKIHYSEAKEIGNQIIYICLILLLITLILYARSRLLLLALSSSFITAALLFLYVGIYSPMLEISAYSENLEVPLKIEFNDMAESVDNAVNMGGAVVSKLSKEFGYEINIPEVKYAKELIGDYKWDFTVVFEGKMYYFHQSKSIDNLIVLLFKDKNYLVAWAILIFSILIPLIKLFVSLLLIYLPKVRKVSTFMLFVKLIGKWSMADVFVAACFLSFLSFYNMNVGIETESNALIGIYFFLTYVVLSLISSTLIWLHDVRELKLLNASKK
jgi:hypothetical protein